MRCGESVSISDTHNRYHRGGVVETGQQPSALGIETETGLMS